MMRLAPGHLEELRASGLSDETIMAAGIFSAPERQVRDLLGYGAGPGMVFPYPALNGSGDYARVKLDHPGPDGTRYRSPAKQSSRLYIPPLLNPKALADARTAIWLTEGEKKALKGCQEGLPCVALPGVWSWKRRDEQRRSVPIPDLDRLAWKGRTVYVVYDSDLATNASVRDAEHALAQELGRRGARVLAVRLPGGPRGEKVGLDDYLITHSVESLCSIEPRPVRNPDLRTGPVVLEAAELLAKEFYEPPAIVGGGILPRQGLAITGGPPKVGKTALVLNKALCRSLGRPWLGFPTEPGRTLVIQAEIPERQLQTRLRLNAEALGAPLPDKRLFFVTYRGLRLDRTEGLQACRRLVEQTRADWLILDPLARFFAGEENSAREVGRLVGALDTLIQELGIAVDLVHHTSKPNAMDPRDGGLRLRGSSALFAAADSVLILDRAEGGFRLTFELRHGKEPEPMLLARTDTLWFVPGGPPEELLAVAAVVATLPLPWSHLVAALKADSGVSRATAERLIGRALKARLIAKDSDGHYLSTLTKPHAQSEGTASAHG